MTTYEIGRPDICTRLVMMRNVVIGAPQYTSGGANIIGGIVVGSGSGIVGSGASTAQRFSVWIA